MVSKVFVALSLLVVFAFSGLFFYSSQNGQTGVTTMNDDAKFLHAVLTTKMPIVDHDALQPSSSSSSSSSTSRPKQQIESTPPTTIKEEFIFSSSPSLESFQILLKEWNLDSIFPLINVVAGGGGGGDGKQAQNTIYEPFQPVSSSSSPSSSLCPLPPSTSVNDDVYDGCPLPGINNVLYTQHTRWFCIYEGRHRKLSSKNPSSSIVSPYLFRDRFCNKGTAEKIRYSSLLQIRYDKIFLSSTSTTIDQKRRNEDNLILQQHDIWMDDENGKPVVFYNKNSDGDSLESNSLHSLVKNSILAVSKRHQNSRYHHTNTHKNNINNDVVRNSACWNDITAKQQKQIPACGWTDVPSFYFTEKFWEARRLIDFHSRYYIVARVLASMLFSSKDNNNNNRNFNGKLPEFISVHLRRGDYYQHCVKVRKGRNVKEWITFSQTPATQNSLFLGKGKPFGRKLETYSDLKYQTRHNETIPGCYPSLHDVEHAFDEISKFTGIKNIFIATNTPQDLIDFGIVEVGGGGEAEEEKKKGQMKRKGKRSWKAVLLPKGSSQLFFKDSRKVDDVILEMALLSLGRFFILNRFSSFSANALEMAIIHNRVNEKPRDWDNVVTW